VEGQLRREPRGALDLWQRLFQMRRGSWPPSPLPSPRTSRGRESRGPHFKSHGEKSRLSPRARVPTCPGIQVPGAVAYLGSLSFLHFPRVCGCHCCPSPPSLPGSDERLGRAKAATNRARAPAPAPTPPRSRTDIRLEIGSRVHPRSGRRRFLAGSRGRRAGKPTRTMIDRDIAEARVTIKLVKPLVRLLAALTARSRGH
jgi:hypothetical protein